MPINDVRYVASKRQTYAYANLFVAKISCIPISQTFKTKKIDTVGFCPKYFGQILNVFRTKFKRVKFHFFTIAMIRNFAYSYVFQKISPMPYFEAIF